ncbi:MAG: hypothetical protein M0021_15685 [Clostridia bacterium]|nr:hypothetical protein [Clostridia bacterium]
MKIVYETERVAQLKKIIKTLEAKELEFLQEYIERERGNRKKEVYGEWLDYLGGMFCKSLH